MLRLVLVVLAALFVPTSSPAPGKAFTIADVGTATGLVPGGTVTRTVRVTNPGNQAISVTRLDTVVGRPSPHCPANAVTATAPATPVVVARNSYADVRLTVRMAASAPDACKSLTFPLTYSGTATKP